MRVSCILLIAFFVLGCERATATCKDDTVWNMTADAFQYRPTINPADAFYKEWWFFTFSDPVSNVAFCMGYSVTDPKQEFGRQSSGVAGMFWPNFQTNTTNIHDITDVYNYTDFSASTQNATVAVGPNNHIQVIDGSTYVITGASLDGTLQWQLTYEQQVPACREIFQVPELLQLDWISYMPSAKVSGYVVWEGKKIPVDGKGYHDHNWGVWPGSLFNWVWAQYNDIERDFALVMGAYNVPKTKEYIGYVFLRINGTQAKIGTLCEDSYSLTPLKFDQWENHPYSVQNHVEVQGKEWWLTIDYATITSGPNPGGQGLDLLVFEQVSQFNVSLSQSDGNGGWNVVVASAGLGFNEWSDLLI